MTPEIRTAADAIAYIHSNTWTRHAPGLERMRELCRRLGDPQKSLRFLHVAGTNGKGSVCAMLDAVLRTAGHRVGLFTSPYLVSFNERIRLNGQPIPDAELAEITARIRPIADSMTDVPTEFELITAIGLAFFARHACDFVVFEVGMGGHHQARRSGGVRRDARAVDACRRRAGDPRGSCCGSGILRTGHPGAGGAGGRSLHPGSRRTSARNAHRAGRLGL